MARKKSDDEKKTKKKSKVTEKKTVKRKSTEKKKTTKSSEKKSTKAKKTTKSTEKKAAKKSSTKKKTTKKSTALTHEDLMATFEDLDFSSVLDEEERSMRLAAQGMSSYIDPNTRISSGVLSLDLIMGGGLQAGAEYEFVGPEHSGKSTTLYKCIGSALKNIPKPFKGFLFNIEGTLDDRWFCNITDVDSTAEVFGVRDGDGGWAVPAQIRYYKVAIGEKSLKLLKRQLKAIPDKILMGDTYYYVWTPVEPKQAKKTGGLKTKDLEKKLKGIYDKQLYKKYGAFYVPVPGNYAGPEFIAGYDSWAAMTPESIAEDDSAAMAAQARMFSKHLNEIKALISAKSGVLIGTNQIREKIGGYGNPEYSPGGNTKKHTTDCRIRFSTISNRNGKGATEVVGVDEYKHFRAINRKNKLFIPFKEVYGRFWTEHAGDSGFGHDPVMDTMTYLENTGQIVKVGNRGFHIVFGGNKKWAKKINKKLEKYLFVVDKYDHKHGKEVSKKSGLTYMSFKQCIIDKQVPGAKKVDIRELCFEQMRTKHGMELYLKTCGNSADVPEEDEDE